MTVALIVGATGLVGRALVEQTLACPEFTQVRCFVRRPCDMQHAKLVVHQVDFNDPRSYETDLKGDVLFSALGTTIRQAGSRAAQYRVDHTYQLQVARAARANGVPCLALVSAAGASVHSPIFYSRMKGELEQEVTRLGFPSLHLLRPSYLDGQRDEARPFEQWGIALTKKLNAVGLLQRWRPIAASSVARAMVALALKGRPGRHLWQPEQLFQLADPC